MGPYEKKKEELHLPFLQKTLFWQNSKTRLTAKHYLGESYDKVAHRYCAFSVVCFCLAKKEKEKKR